MILERSKALQAENTTLRMEKERLSSDLSLTKENLADRINEGEQQTQLICELEDHVEKLQVHYREIGYLTDSKKVTITTIPRPMEQIYGEKIFWKNSKIGPPRASKIQAICPAEIWL